MSCLNLLRANDEFESACFSTYKESLEHPESSAAEQNKFLNYLKALCNLVEEGAVINPFKETGHELITLDTGTLRPSTATGKLQTLTKAWSHNV